MKTSVLLALATGAHAAVHFSFAKQVQQQPAFTASRRVDSRSTIAGLAYSGATYAVNVTVGTPGQVVTLALSTSSTKTWVADARSDYCTTHEYDDDTEEYTPVVDTECLSGTCE